MNESFRFAVILLIICLLAACQNPPTATVEPIIEETVEVTDPTEAQSENPLNSNLPTVKFYSKNSTNDNQPQY